METSHDIYGAPELHPGNSNRPKVTFALFAYNQERYIRAAVEGALSQKYEALEIILSDDASSDSTFRIMKEIIQDYNGPHSIRLNRNASNLGLAEHVNYVLGLASGEIILFSAGDDISLPTRVKDTVEVFLRHPDAMAVSFDDIRIDSDGGKRGASISSGEELEIDLNDFVEAGPRAQSKLGLSGASRAIRTKVFDAFGELMQECSAEDSPYLLRSLYLGKIIFCQWPGILYRCHSDQMSSDTGVIKKDEVGFVRQFQADLRKALDGGLIDKEMSAKIGVHIREFKADLVFRKLAILQESVSMRQLLMFLWSRQYSLREKLGLIKRFITRRPI